MLKLLYHVANASLKKENNVNVMEKKKFDGFCYQHEECKFTITQKIKQLKPLKTDSPTI
jgi:hypothetical protein